MSLYYLNEQTGAEARLGRTGAGFYVEARHPDFPLPLRKTYEWFQQDIAILRVAPCSGKRGFAARIGTRTLNVCFPAYNGVHLPCRITNKARFA
jgi:hypothetical protein